jgi:cell division protein FtsW
LGLLNKIKGDKVIWIIVLLLSLVSIAVVYSSVAQLAFKYKGGNTSYYLIKHSLIIGFGILLMYFIHKIRYSYFSRISQIGIWLAAPLLLYTLIKGVSAGEAARWLEIPGTGLTFQTSDFAKLVLLIYVARVLAIKQNELTDFKVVLLYLLLPIATICGLIFPANFSTSALLFCSCYLLMFIGGVPIKYLLMIMGAGIVFISVIVLLIFNFPDAIPRGQTWKTRIENFSSGDAEENYQAEQAKIAIGTSGVLYGKGPGNSTQRGFLPQASSDFIYAIWIEEFGLIAGVSVLLLYLILLFRGIKIAQLAGKNFGTLMVFGLCFSLVFQALVNMAVAVNLFPVTGQPLPLISMGGTSIWFTSITIGIILSVSKENTSEKEQEETDEQEA